MYYHNDRIGSKSEDTYTDILHGEVAKEHLHGMDSNYNAWSSEDFATRADTVPVNLLLIMDFYNGGQLLHCWKVADFWCFLTFIVNLPPAYREKLEILTFLSAVYAGKHRTAERLIL